MMRRVLLALAAVLALSTVSLAYTVKLKDGSLIFARTKYTLKGKKAIITLRNGTVTQLDVDTVDIPGTDKYNAENPGDVLALETQEEVDPKSRVPKPQPTSRLQDMLKQRKERLELPPSNPVNAAPKDGASWQPVEQGLQETFQRVFDGAGITQWRLQNFRGTLKLLATANTEQAVFNTLSAAARALADWGNRGNTATLEISLTTSGSEPGGTFHMTTDLARQVVNGNLTAQDFFLKHVVL